MAVDDGTEGQTPVTGCGKASYLGVTNVGRGGRMPVVAEIMRLRLRHFDTCYELP